MVENQTGTPINGAARANAFSSEYVQNGPGTVVAQHRRTQLSEGWVEGDRIRCLYHGWKFGSDGACQERPAEMGTGGIRIKTYPTEEFLGFIYGYFGEGAPPPFPPFPALELEALRSGRPSKQWAFMTNPPGGLSAEPFLNPLGIAEAGESSGTPTSAGTY